VGRTIELLCSSLIFAPASLLICFSFISDRNIRLKRIARIFAIGLQLEETPEESLARKLKNSGCFSVE